LALGLSPVHDAASGSFRVKGVALPPVERGASGGVAVTGVTTAAAPALLPTAAACGMSCPRTVTRLAIVAPAIVRVTATRRRRDAPIGKGGWAMEVRDGMMPTVADHPVRPVACR